jgi:hypothetical protein
MRSLALALVLALVPAGMALADHDIGCGVGTQIMKGQKGLGPKLAGSCTNGLTFQSISITFGVMGCNGRNEVTTADAELRKFAAGNFDRLVRDMANGEGETLAAFSLLLGVREADQPRFFAFAQSRFADIFPSESTTAAEMLGSLERLLAEEARLAAHAGI